MARRKNKPDIKKLTALIIAIIIGFLAYEAKDISVTSDADFTDSSAVYVHFIDVGQGSATLIQQGTKGVIIDAGEKEYGESVVKYIENVGVKELVLAVASHPHSDHIGGLDEVLYAFGASEILLPELTESNTPTTKVYEDLLTVTDDKNIAANFIFDDTFYCNMTNDVEVIVTAPTEQSDNINDMSLLCYINCFDTTFFIPGDAEKGELKSVYNVSDIYDLGADIMAMAHHGSGTSIYEPYLDAVDADVAVISCGKNNSYGHPHTEALEYIAENNMTCLRTDESGDIVFKVTEDGYSLVD